MREVAPRSDLTREVRGRLEGRAPKISNLIHRPPLLFVIGMRAHAFPRPALVHKRLFVCKMIRMSVADM